MDGKPSPGNRSGRKKNLSIIIIIIIIIISYKKNCIKTFEQVLKKLKNIQCSWMSLSSKQIRYECSINTRKTIVH